MSQRHRQEHGRPLQGAAPSIPPRVPVTLSPPIAPPAAAPTPAPPLRWEHKIAEIGRAGEWLPPLEDDGWEVVAVIDSRVDSLRVLLKRPRAAKETASDPKEPT